MRTGKKLLALLLTLSMALSLTVTAAAAEENGGVTILYTNDIHTYIDQDLTYSLVAAYKDSLENALLVDAGDHIQGTAYGGMDQGATIIELMNAAGYDLATLGNHEFDYDMEGCIAAMEAADFPYVSCNFYHEADGSRGENVLDSYEVFELGGVSVAIIGITTPESFTKSTPAYFQDDNGDYIYGIAGGPDGEELYDAIQEAVDAASAEADYVIALGHLGVDESSQPWTSREVIANTTGLDVFIDGHSHTTLPMEEVTDEGGDTVILTQTGSYLDAVGQLTISQDGTITTALLTAEDLSGLTPDPAVKALEDAWIGEIEEQLGQVIGYAEVTLDNYDAEGSRLVRKQETNTGDFAADALYYLFDSMGMDVDVAVMNGGGIRNGAVTGEITYQTCKEIHTFGNVACLITVTGQQLLDALEWGAKDMTADGAVENGGFLHVSGLRYTVNTAIPSTVQQDELGVWTGGPTGGYRVTAVEVLNNETGVYEPLSLTGVYNLAGYNYTLRNLGDGFAMFQGAENVLDYVAEDYMVLADYLQSFPVDEATGLPTISVGSQYADVNGSGRITIVHEPVGYADVAEGAWYAGAVSYVTANGLMAGATETTFAPNAPITGADLTAALNAIAPAEAETGGQSVTREALAALLWIRAGSPAAGADLSAFSDADSISGENRTAMAWAVSQGLLAGYGNGTLGPDGILTRAQAATVVMRLHQAVLSEGGLALPNDSQQTAVQWERQFTVVIDPGHGGRQPGAHYSGVSEKEINLAVALKLENLLTARGYQVVMTRSDDTGIGLYERAELANASGADLFVSLHSNAMANAPNFQGILTYHYPSNSSGAELAQSIQTAVCQVTGGTDRGVRSADFVVLRETDMSAALVEMGYMSSPGELARLLDASYQDKLAQGIAEGIARYLGAPE